MQEMAYLSHFCTRKKRLKFPDFLILHSKQTSVDSVKNEQRNTYGVLIAISVAGALLVLFIAGAPVSAIAFWPFSSVRAQESGEPPVLHDATIGLLSAPTNSDPTPEDVSDIEITSGSALISNSGPEGTLPATSGGTSGGSISLYQVREGDSLSVIAQMFGVTTNTILWANDIKDAKTIRPGDTLLILPVSGIQYTVKKGGTLTDVAKLFDADVDEIALFNGIDPSAPLAPGTELIIPGGNLSTPKVATKTPVRSTSVSTTAALPILTGYFGNPVPGARLTQGIHGYNGIDLGSPNGTPVYASAAGTVIVAKNNGGYNGGYGNYIVIKHDNGTQTLYAHLSSVAISVGGAVEKGERIGGVGNTGRSTGNHLHFEVRGARNPFAK